MLSTKYEGKKNPELQTLRHFIQDNLNNKITYLYIHVYIYIFIFIYIHKARNYGPVFLTSEKCGDITLGSKVIKRSFEGK